MTDGGLVAIRFALYADLMLLAGLAAFPLYSLTQAERDDDRTLPLTATLIWLALAGLVFSAFGFAISSATMMGVPLSAINVPMLFSMASETEQGAAWLARMAVLAAAFILLTALRRQPLVQYSLAFTCGAAALSTLLWSGHAAATEGALGTVHRISDVAHMLAAAIWIGGITAFGLLLWRPVPSDADMHIVMRSLANFSHVGTLAVAVIGITGLVNGYAIIGTNAATLVQSPYGILLTTKLILFVTMLGLAANNRWKLVPALSQVGGDIKVAWRKMRISIALEAAGGATILALVAWLGTLAPM